MVVFGSRFSHDEHQFVAPALLLREGLHPTVDYLYLHTPLQAYLYALFIPSADRAVLTSRAIAAACAFATLVVLYAWNGRSAADVGPLAPRLIAVGCVAALVLSDTFDQTTGRAWNHGTSTLLAVLAFVLVQLAIAHDRRWLMAVAGALASLAVGFRLTWAPLLVPLALGCVVLDPRLTARRAAGWILAFGAGAALGLLPTAVIAAANPSAFWYGNFVYPLVNNQYFRAAGVESSFTAKAQAVVQLLRTDASLRWLTLLVAAAGVGVAFALWRGGRAGGRAVAFAAVVLAFVTAGSLAPGQLHTQYLYGPLVFAALFLAPAAALLVRSGVPARAVVAALATCLALMLLNAPTHWRQQARNLSPVAGGAPYPVRAERLAAELGELLDERAEVVTLAPAFPLMAGLRTDPSLASGPFAWRTAGFIDADRRAAVGWRGPDELHERDPAEAPAAILTGMEPEALERPLVEFAEARGYVPVPLTKTIGTPVLWLSPACVEARLAAGQGIPGGGEAVREP